MITEVSDNHVGDNRINSTTNKTRTTAKLLFSSKNILMSIKLDLIENKNYNTRNQQIDIKFREFKFSLCMKCCY